MFISDRDPQPAQMELDAPTRSHCTHNPARLSGIRTATSRGGNGSLFSFRIVYPPQIPCNEINRLVGAVAGPNGIALLVEGLQPRALVRAEPAVAGFYFNPKTMCTATGDGQKEIRDTGLCAHSLEHLPGWGIGYLAALDGDGSLRPHFAYRIVNQQSEYRNQVARFLRPVNEGEVFV